MFYSNKQYGMAGPFGTLVRGVQIELTITSKCDILEIPQTGLCLFKTKGWLFTEDSNIG